MLGALYSVFAPSHRIWPPPGRDSWQFWVTWTVLTLGLSGVVVVGALDLGSLGLGYPAARLVTGGALMLAGSLIMIWSVITLSLRQSLGLKGGLVTGGPYMYTRNPQYVGYLLFYPGFMVFSGSYEAVVTGVLAMLVFIVAPFAEEPWLLEQFGEEYRRYKERTPRFI